MTREHWVTTSVYMDAVKVGHNIALRFCPGYSQPILSQAKLDVKLTQAKEARKIRL